MAFVIDPKGSRSQAVDMDDSTTRTTGSTVARNRATRRLRTLTIGTTLAGVAASAGFGWVAAATYAGAPSTGSTLDPSTTTPDSSISGPVTVQGSSGVTGTTGDSGSISGPTSGSSGSSSTGSSGQLRSSSGRAHVSTGAS